MKESDSESERDLNPQATHLQILLEIKLIDNNSLLKILLI